MDERCFQAKEHTLDKDLHKGKADHAAALLLDEFQSDPSQALALVKSEMSRQSQGPNRDKLHINVENNGDVVIWDRGEKNGRYAGDPRDARVLFRAQVEGAELAHHVAVADVELGGLAGVLLVLRHRADRGKSTA